ncbi:MAG: ABC-type transport auxiliary lipoprotein family protein [Rhizomicrobium sp.]|nr:ABC-type transport auxiliary lipoprotein family protein [Rhizomicrobium sp.]
MTIMLHRRALFAAASGLVVAGCADIVGPPPAPKLYVLEPKFAAVPGAAVAWALSVQAPDSTAGLDSERIVIARPPAGLDFYANAAWSDRVPMLVQSALVEAFERSGRIASVAQDSAGTRTDLILNTNLRDFEARYDAGEGAPLAVVRLGARLIEARSRRIVGTTEISKEVRAAANSVDAGVAALTEAFSAALAQLVPWVLQHSPA